jgi:hypothetical protein
MSDATKDQLKARFAAMSDADLVEFPLAPEVTAAELTSTRAAERLGLGALLCHVQARRHRR